MEDKDIIINIETQSEPKPIRDWEELSKETSETHVLEIELDGGCGWIGPKNGEGEIGVDRHYLSTHTFYGGTNKYSTKLLQSCGFNVVLANWDEIGL
jgi:hypothetical protein